MKKKKNKKNAQKDRKTKQVVRKITLLISFLTIVIILLLNICYLHRGRIIKNVKEVAGQDGYTTIFQSNQGKEYKEYKQGGNASWAHKEYWDNQMWDNGCAITSLAIIASGYHSSDTPEEFRKKYYPHLDGDTIPDALREDYNIECTDFYYSKQEINEDTIINWLITDRPILICVVNKPDSRWTKASHYMVLLDYDENKVYISNPNQTKIEKKDSSGWYKMEEILPYIVKAVFIKKD